MLGRFEHEKRQRSHLLNSEKEVWLTRVETIYLGVLHDIFNALLFYFYFYCLITSNDTDVFIDQCIGTRAIG